MQIYTYNYLICKLTGNLLSTGQTI